MRLKQLLLVLFLGSSVFCYAQKPYYNQTPEFLKANGVWALYNRLGLNFNDPANFQFTDSMPRGAQLEGCASVADPKTGKLLFYSNGGSCWNRNNRVMPNGAGLYGNSDSNYYSTTQGVCIVPFINDPEKYYLFSLGTISGYTSYTQPSKLYYSVVDISLDNGLGDIVSTKKNISLDSALLSESMIAVPGNNCDIWLLTHTRDSAIFKAYHITSTGIDTKPVYSYTNTRLQGIDAVPVPPLNQDTFSFAAYAQGSMKISSDKKKLAITSGGLGGPIRSTLPDLNLDLIEGTLLYDFDAASGIVSNAVLIDTIAGYDVAFSPDNSKLYISSAIDLNQPLGIYQLDISIMDSAKIANSKIALATWLGSQYANLKLYNDTIYVGAPSHPKAIGRINQPNLSGSACDYEANAITFSGSGSGWKSLPNDVVLPPAPDTSYSKVMDTLICSQITLKPEISSDDYVYKWNNGSTDSILNVVDNGVYWVKYNNGCHYRVDTFVLHGMDLNPIINIDSFDLSTTAHYSSYQWLLNGNIIPGATDSVYTVTQNGKYQVIVANEQGCTDTSDVYLITNYTGITDVHLLAKAIKIYPNPATDKIYIQSPVKINTTLTDIEGRVIRNIKNAHTISLKNLETGIYLLRITDEKGVLLKVQKLVKAG